MSIKKILKHSEAHCDLVSNEVTTYIICLSYILINVELTTNLTWTLNQKKKHNLSLY